MLSTENFIHDISEGWRVAGAEDFDHDGDADLLLANDTTRENVIWTMNGLTVVDTEHFLPIRTPGWYVAGTGDFDGDGWADILVRYGDSWNPLGTVVVNKKLFGISRGISADRPCRNLRGWGRAIDTPG